MMNPEIITPQHILALHTPPQAVISTLTCAGMIVYRRTKRYLNTLVAGATVACSRPRIAGAPSHS
jgi:hypothetical protein